MNREINMFIYKEEVYIRIVNIGMFFDESFEKIFGSLLLVVCVYKMWDDLYKFEFIEEMIVSRMIVFMI